MSKSPHPSFGPGYVPPAERIRREQASQRQPGPGHDLRPRHSRGKSNGLNPWLVGLIAAVSTAVFVARVLHESEVFEHNNASCEELDAAIGHYLDTDPNAQGVHIERSRDVLEEVEIQARVSGEFAAALESLELPDPRVSDLRDRFVEHALESEEVFSSYRCTFIANQAEVCDFVPPDAPQRLDRERSQLFKDFNRTCRDVGTEWALETEQEPE